MGYPLATASRRFNKSGVLSSGQSLMIIGGHAEISAVKAVHLVGRRLFGRRHCASPSGPVIDGAVSLRLCIDNFVRDPAQALTQALAVEIELREHVVAPGDTE